MNDVPGVGFVVAVASVSSANTTAKPSFRWKSMWQCKNQGPGLSVYNKRQCSVQMKLLDGEMRIYLESNSHIVTRSPNIYSIANYWVDEIGPVASCTSDDPEIVLEENVISYSQ